MGQHRCDDAGLEPLLDELERVHVVQSFEISRRGLVAQVKIGVIVEPDELLTTRIASILGRFPFSLEQVRPNVLHPD
jgi:hypothetical protein